MFSPGVFSYTGTIHKTTPNPYKERPMSSKTGSMIAAGAAAAIAPILIMTTMTTSMLSGMGTIIATEAGNAAINASAADCEETTETTVATISIGKLEGDSTAARLANAFSKAGFSKEATAGMMGNVQWESGFRADSINEIGATGIMQWYPGSKITDWFNTQDDLKGRPATDEEGQIRMAVWVGQDTSSWNNEFISKAKAEGMRAIGDDLYRSWREASSPEDAALAWHWGFERADDSTGPRRQTAARGFYDKGLEGLSFTGKPNSDNTAETTSTRCSTTNGGSSGNVKAGSAGGAPDDTDNYAWMCSAIGVCKDGDGFEGSPKVKYPHNVSRYQCVWYAWNRLGMIHGNDGWDTVMGNGGVIASNLQGKPGWTVDGSPHPGDGVSQLGGALGGDTSVGHVAVVEDVKTEGGKWKIRISEGNCDGTGAGNWTGYRTRWLTQDQFAGAQVFFRNGAWK